MTFTVMSAVHREQPSQSLLVLLVPTVTHTDTEALHVKVLGIPLASFYFCKLCILIHSCCFLCLFGFCFSINQVLLPQTNKTDKKRKCSALKEVQKQQSQMRLSPLFSCFSTNLPNSFFLWFHPRPRRTLCFKIRWEKGSYWHIAVLMFVCLDFNDKYVSIFKGFGLMQFEESSFSVK